MDEQQKITIELTVQEALIVKQHLVNAVLTAGFVPLNRITDELIKLQKKQEVKDMESETTSPVVKED